MDSISTIMIVDILDLVMESSMIPYTWKEWMKICNKKTKDTSPYDRLNWKYHLRSVALNRMMWDKDCR